MYLLLGKTAQNVLIIVASLSIWKNTIHTTAHIEHNLSVALVQWGIILQKCFLVTVQVSVSSSNFSFRGPYMQNIYGASINR